ncbi:phage major capsid protein [Mycobacterium sp. Y57]|uniref:phage major capsid protein n=1 Tax=Mycolicibacterium xanthum TaxID=2796469 RepID=UPI001C8446CE|nr:phage major capsid protein [Mycolicibacterium xanthum]MBX7434172.1 phage major capsid protein [Mycolicibacterium xanthum]
MTLLSSAAGGVLKPEQIGPLVVQPLTEQSVAMQVSTVIATDSPEFRFPRVTSTPTGGWFGEAEEIDLSDPGIDEKICTPKAFKSLTKISNELVNDSSPKAADLVGQLMAADIARAVDARYFGGTLAKAPDGLASLAGAQLVDAGTAWDSLDPFADAIAKATDVGATITAWCASSATVNTLMKLKQFSGDTDSLVPLLGSDPNMPTRKQVLGIPLYGLPAGVIDDTVIWAICREKAFVVLRNDVSLAVDQSAYFSSDSVGVRSVIRLDFAWPHEQAVIQLSISGS